MSLKETTGKLNCSLFVIGFQEKWINKKMLMFSKN